MHTTYPPGHAGLCNRYELVEVQMPQEKSAGLGLGLGPGSGPGSGLGLGLGLGLGRGLRVRALTNLRGLAASTLACQRRFCTRG